MKNIYQFTIRPSNKYLSLQPPEIIAPLPLGEGGTRAKRREGEGARWILQATCRTYKSDPARPPFPSERRRTCRATSFGDSLPIGEHQPAHARLRKLTERCHGPFPILLISPASA